MRVTRAFVALSLLATLWPAIATAQADKAGVVTTLEGHVTAARTATPQPVALKFKDDVFVNDRVVTGDRSLARLLLGGRAVVTVRERSALTITELPGRSIIDLDSGKIAVAVAKDKMRPGDQIEVRTPNAVAAVRGTVFVVEVLRASAATSQAQAGVTTNVFAFAGALVLTVGNQSLNLLPNTFATATGIGLNSGPITPQMRASALAGLSPTGTQPVEGGNTAAKNAAMGATVATFTSGTLPITSLVLPAAPPPPSIPTPFPGSNRGSTTTVLTPTVSSIPSVCFPPSCVGNPTPQLPPAPPGTITPDSILNVPGISPPFGRLVDGGLVTDQYRSVGLLFGPTRVAIFNDPPLAWAGVNARDRVDLVSPVSTSFVMPGTSTPAKTNHLSVEVGLAPVGSILLEAFGTAGMLLGSTTNDDGIGPHGRTLATLDLDGIRSFSVSGNDTWGMNQIEYGELVDPPSVVTLQSALLHAVHEQRQAFSTFFDMADEAVTGESSEPLIWLTGSTFATGHHFALLSNSAVTSAGSFLRLDDGSRIVQAGAGEPLVWMRGGSLSVGTGSDGGHLFELIGRSGATAVDLETGLTVGTDRPLELGTQATVFEADNGATVSIRGSAYKIDTALLEATAPLLNLNGGTAVTTSGHVVDLVRQAKVSLPNDALAMISLNGSSLSVLSGHLVNVAGGSVLNIAGNLVSLGNGSTLTLFNGLLVNVSGGSSASIGRSLVSFSGTGNALYITNSVIPTAIINGIPVAGAVDSFRIGTNALRGLGTSGTISINGVALTPTTPLASLTGSLIAVQSGGTVKVAQ